MLEKLKQIPSVQKKIILLSPVAITFGVALGMVLMETALPLQITTPSGLHRVDQPVTFRLNQKLRSIDSGSINITPAVSGKWKLERGGLLADDTLTLSSDQPFKLNTTYTVNFPASDRIVPGKTPPKKLQFTTEAAPRIIDSTLQQQPSVPIAADQTVVVTFNGANRGIRELEIRSEPNISFTKTISRDGKTYSWRPAKYLPQDSKLTLELFDTKNKTSLQRSTFTVASEPSLAPSMIATNITKQDGFTLQFTKAIDRTRLPDSAINFADAGNGVWKDDSTYVFTPTTLTPGKSYTYTINPGLRSREGGILLKSITGSFQTRGAVSVTHSTPVGSELHQAKQLISFTFNQPVDRESAQRNFSISSGTITDYDWNSATMTVAVANLGHQKSVTASVAAGVKNAEFGLPSTEVFSTNFTTEARATILSVPHYRQQHAATCAVASLRMILAYRGISVDEMTIVNRIGYSPTVMDKSTTPGTWDDPMQMFVGSIDGNIKDGTGAGPDAPPVAKAAQSLGRNASAVTNINASWIAQQLYSGNPVIMFGAYGNANGYIDWKTRSGGSARMHVTSHATAVVGVKGEPSAPLGFWVQDPLTNGRTYWSTATVNTNIAKDPYRQAVVVY